MSGRRRGVFGARATVGLCAAVLTLVGACRRAPVSAADGACAGCHAGIERASASHDGCTSCHGGDAKAVEKAAAHSGIYGISNASYVGRWERGCGTCHRHQVARVASSQMYTTSGMIAQIQATWDGERPDIAYAARAGEHFGPEGEPGRQVSVGELDHLSGELYRKFCSRCHVARQNEGLDGAGHPAGCAACHFPYDDGATYRGGDPTMRGKSPYGSSHAMQGLPPMQACQRCHQRSGRIALSYQGLLDGNNGLVPTRDGLPGPLPASDERSFSHVAPDVHFLAGMECIDCHTSREVMGEGYAAADMQGQLEVRCEDCHGDGASRPRFAEAARESDAPIRESRQYALPVRPGTRMALTSKGRPYSNVFEREGRVMLATKRAGRLLESPVIAGTPEHRISGHERMECAACHSRTVVQCYGCHTAYDKREGGWDFIQDRETPGAFSETEDYRTLYPFPLAVNRRGGIAPVTPGCQTSVTVIEADGSRSKDEWIAPYKGRPQYRFAPFYGHNTGPKAIGCGECHANPAFLGFGQGVLEQDSIRATLLCERSDRKPLDGFLSMEKGRVVAHSAITRKGARPLEDAEVRRVLAANLCIVCHVDGEDPIYRERLDHGALRDALHRRLLAAGR
ncbi:MAG: selenite/tellurite reduction operon c-type cytochrome ExtM [Vicinamibacteria bacterium]